MSDTIIKSVFLDEPRRDGEYPEGACVGYDGITRIEKNVESCGTYTVIWFDAYKGEQLFKSFGARHVAVVTYEAKS